MRGKQLGCEGAAEKVEGAWFVLELYLHLNQGLICRSQKSLTTSADSTLTIPTHYPYAFYRPHHLRFQIAVLALSLLKSLEIYTLFLLGGALVGILSGVPFLFSFVSGVCLEIYGIITSCRPVEINGHFDLIAASPTTKRLGGPRIPSARVFSARSQWFDIIYAQSSGGEDGLEPLFVPRGE